MLGIILELQGERWQRAEDLAATFETSKRTIYRDVQALLELSVPVVSAPGRGYSILAGYFLPPLSFSPDEATMLLLGAGVMQRSFDAEYQAAARFAAQKIEHVLPPNLLERVRQLQANIHLYPSINLDSDEATILQTARGAILRGNRVRFVYHTRIGEDGQSATNQREVDPYGLFFVEGAWHLYGYCHLRHDTRNFRLSRIEHLSILPQGFERPADYTREAARRMDESRTLIARLQFDHEVARWVSEDTFFYIEERTPNTEGIAICLRLRHERDALNWILSWGRHVRVLAPKSLRALVQAELRAALEQT
jgi:predicted DNA-binding transcriptional regulator YafY